MLALIQKGREGKGTYVINRDINLLLSFREPSIIGRRLELWNKPHRLLDKPMSLILQLLPVPYLPCIRPPPHIIIRWRRTPTAFLERRHHIVNFHLLRDLLNTQLQSIRLDLFGRHRRDKSRDRAHQPENLVLLGTGFGAPAAFAFAGTASIGIGFDFERAGGDGGEEGHVAGGVDAVCFACKALAGAQGDVVCAGDGAFVSPRHFGQRLEIGLVN